MRREVDWTTIESLLPEEARAAASEAQLLALGPENAMKVRALIDDDVRGTDKWVLVGGPPCQAYSLVGRARRSKSSTYVAAKDERQTLYVEYLQVLADHAPPVFVMENVKGLLSAELFAQRLFTRIREDLRSPASALRREGRPVRRLNPQYEIFALSERLDLFGDDPSGYVIRSEDYGIPQRRHRVILLGVRSDVVPRTVPVLERVQSRKTVAQAFEGLPRLRSGISRAADSDQQWKSVLRSVRRRDWVRDCDVRTRNAIRDSLEHLSVPRAGRGSDYLINGNGRVKLNHSSRSHIVSDLERYLFASAYAQTHGESPKLTHFPRALLPDHANVDRATGEAVFADRFRVQLGNEPSTTVTSHISKDGHYYIHPDPRQCRSLTVREAARLQTFPNDYFFCGPRTAQYQQVGNAVPPQLATRIARIVAEVLDG